MINWILIAHLLPQRKNDLTYYKLQCQSLPTRLGRDVYRQCEMFTFTPQAMSEFKSAHCMFAGVHHRNAGVNNDLAP
jgi:hypothetical protein